MVSPADRDLLEQSLPRDTIKSAARTAGQVTRSPCHAGRGDGACFWDTNTAELCRAGFGSRSGASLAPPAAGIPKQLRQPAQRHPIHKYAITNVQGRSAKYSSLPPHRNDALCSAASGCSCSAAATSCSFWQTHYLPLHPMATAKRLLVIGSSPGHPLSPTASHRFIPLTESSSGL